MNGIHMSSSGRRADVHRKAKEICRFVGSRGSERERDEKLKRKKTTMKERKLNRSWNGCTTWPTTEGVIQVYALGWYFRFYENQKPKKKRDASEVQAAVGKKKHTTSISLPIYVWPVRSLAGRCTLYFHVSTGQILEGEINQFR